MRKKWLFPALSAVAVSGTLMSPIAANAATLPTPLTGYGFDGNAHLVVGGGSTTLYKIAQGVADLYNSTASCATNNSTYNPATSGGATAYPQTNPAFNQCSPTSQTYSGVAAGGNYDGDTIAIAAPDGSSTGIASLNGYHGGTSATYAYEGTNANLQTSGDPNSGSSLSNGGVTSPSGYTNGYGTVDFALSSRAAKTTGGNCPIGGNELSCDTFWGVAADGVEVFTWGSTQGSTTDDTNTASSSGLTATDLYNIYSCKDTTWGQVSGYSADPSAYPPAASPIVPWSMNSNSGTFADFNNYVTANDGTNGAIGGAGSTTLSNTDASMYTGGTTNPQPASSTGCVRELSTADGTFPLENDVKPIVNYVSDTTNSGGGGLSTDTASTNNPANWVWFGSYGLLTAYSYLSQPVVNSSQINTYPVPIAGISPSVRLINKGTYPIPRTLSIVTRSGDASCPVASNVCDFTDNPGPTNGNGATDLNVTGGTSGVSGAIREFLRFVCRPTSVTYQGASTPVDPYTGISDATEIGAVYTASGFATLPKVTAGSSCLVTP